MRSARATIAVIILVGCTLVGCSMNRWVEVESGTYAPTRGIGAAGQAAARTIQEVKIDRDHQTATFTLADGSEIVTSFVPRARAEWPAGCPANIGSTRMEVLDIEDDTLTIESVTFSDPILVRDCPPDPMRVVLREDGAIGGGGGACTHLNKCAFFVRRATHTSPTTPIPPSMKGYELYSWQVGQEWYFTLITGTNRIKTYEEVTTSEDVSETKITVQGIYDLKAALSRLPADTYVVWRGPQRLEQFDMMPGNLALPPGNVIDEVKAHCEEIGVQLQVDK